MTTSRNKESSRVKFTQLVVKQWDGDDGKRQGSIVALGDDGCVYQYYHSEKAWIALSDVILRRS
jgi:hypothetical protein